MKRLAMSNSSNSGALFDPNGPTSLGSLPQGRIIPRLDSLVVTSTEPAQHFNIGAITHVNPIPDAVMEHGIAEFRKRNQGAVDRARYVTGQFQGGDYNVLTNVKVSALEEGKEPLSSDGSAAASNQANSNGFLSQGLENPTTRTI